MIDINKIIANSIISNLKIQIIPGMSLQWFDWNYIIRGCQSALNSQFQEEPVVYGNDKDKVNGLKNKIKQRIEVLSEDLKSPDANKSNLNERIVELNKALNEIEVILREYESLNVESYSDTPLFSYDGNIATIKYDGTVGSFLHELKHAYQFLTGKIDFIRINASGTSEVVPGLTYDLGDEVEAYRRQLAYEGILKYRVELSSEELKKEFFINPTDLGAREVSLMNQVKAEVIVKISDGIAKNGLYKYIPSKSLDTTTSLDQIINENKRRKNLVDGLGLKSYSKKTPYIEFVKVFIIKNPYIYVK